MRSLRITPSDVRAGVFEEDAAKAVAGIARAPRSDNGRCGRSAAFSTAAIVILVLAGCAAKQEGAAPAADAPAPPKAVATGLTRDEAKRQIEAQPKFATLSHVTGIPSSAFHNSVDDGMRDLRGMDWSPTSKGAAYFSDGGFPGEVTLRTPVRREVSDITGITDGDSPNVKIVEFNWHFADVSDAVARYTGLTKNERAGKAQFRKYDDGWRIESVDQGSGL
jgi:hypothetical protein